MTKTTVIILTLTILAVTAVAAAAFTAPSGMHHHSVAFQRVWRFQQQPALFVSANDISSSDSTAEDTKALEIKEETPKTPTPRQTFKNLSTGKIQELKIDVGASPTNPFDMAWWAYAMVIIPFTLLANDVFHFLPKSI